MDTGYSVGSLVESSSVSSFLFFNHKKNSPYQDMHQFNQGHTIYTNLAI